MPARKLFDYPLPKELIAQAPLAQRDASRLLVADRKTKALSDRVFSDILNLLPAGDILVLNNTKVFPARLLGRKKGTGGKVDLLLLGSKEDLVWRCLAQPSSMKEGQEVEFDNGRVGAVYLKRDQDGTPLFRFEGVSDVRALAEKIGQTPLPPYIKREPAEEDKTVYQTVYALKEGAVAAPTAGLHFTRQLLEKIRDKGIEILNVTLHVGYGTFKPVEDPETHQMHSEAFELTPEVTEKINRAKAAQKGIWAVGTTTLRVLETCVQKRKLIPGKGQTNLFIQAPFPFEIVDRLITNFHLPKTTLLLLVSALMGDEFTKKAYEHAIAERYRFYSYGD
ncbi:MAG: tRNA preQ1(34) S-adenosylmethionine ribosyltransferase-isomerase QueA, partial [Candidatus Omnitrophica bacterium]|nr:tRNA preQ1(34) S-adenosylmethionine ribosyltransferase-isomerase QueA [Candidatus Omnitrophota bacterium]